MGIGLFFLKTVRPGLKKEKAAGNCCLRRLNLKRVAPNGIRRAALQVLRLMHVVVAKPRTLSRDMH
jgi:hypothetical protein